MPYTLTHTDGSVLIPGGLPDGTYNDRTTSLVLVGKNLAGYGQFINENFIKLLENFANSTAPGNPLPGQLWWDNTHNLLKVYSGVSWKIAAGATAAPYTNPPNDLSTVGGDLWYDTSNSQLKVWSGTTWITVGPLATPSTGDTKVAPALVTDLSGTTHITVQLTINGQIGAIFARENFNTSINGFTNVLAGMNFNSSATTTSGTPITWSLPTNSQISTLNIVTAALALNNLGANIGSPTKAFSDVYATRFHGSLADLAERFEADAEYEPGTVVELGGNKEITKVLDDLSENVFGVISTNAAYIMNASAGNNITHPPVAVQGRVPVKTIGPIRKGQRLVSAGRGLARAGQKDEITAWNVIGRALENKNSTGEGTIEAVVKLNS